MMRGLIIIINIFNHLMSVKYITYSTARSMSAMASWWCFNSAHRADLLPSSVLYSPSGPSLKIYIQSTKIFNCKCKCSPGVAERLVVQGEGGEGVARPELLVALLLERPGQPFVLPGCGPLVQLHLVLGLGELGQEPGDISQDTI